MLAWREVVVTADLVGPTARASMPVFRQLVVADPSRELSGVDLDRRAYRLRKRAEREHGLYFASLSARTLAYKGMLTTGQLEPFFADLSDPRYASEIALVHSRFSTNTFPSWPLAQPFRMIAHNGEINTVRGNRNWMAAREGTLASDELGDLTPLLPVCTPGGSDSGSFDEVLELLHLSGRSLPHAVMMMIPEAWENHAQMDPARRAFYEYHSTLMEPWDGPAAMTFTDGTLIGSVQDRNGLRPGRYWVTEDGLVVCASEAGVLDIDPATVVAKGRLEPGRMFLVDTGKGRIIDDQEIKSTLAAQRPYAEWVRDNSVYLAQLPEREHVAHSAASVRRRQRAFGYTEEELKILLSPMAAAGAEPLGAMGSDTPVAVLSSRPRMLFDYFTQMFAQVTNPPLDAIREELVTAIGGAIGPEPNLLEDGPGHARKLILPFPVIDNDQLAKIVHVAKEPSLGFRSTIIRGLYKVSGGGEALEARLEEIFAEVDAAVADGVSFIVLSDRNSDADLAPIPSLLLLSAVHHHTLRRHTRTHDLAGRRGRRRARGAPRRAAHRLRRGRGQPVPGHGDRRGPGALGLPARRRPGEGRRQPHQGARQGRPEGHVEDGHLDHRVLPRRAGVRGHRAVAGARRPVLHRHDEPARRHRPGRHRGRGRGAARRRVPGQRQPPGAPAARGRRRVPVASRRRGPPVRPRDRVPPAALDADAAVRHLPAVHEPGRRAVVAADDAARPAGVQGRRAHARCRSTRSSRSARSSSGSTPAPCRTAPSRWRRTRRSRSR